ncbi:MAG: hypothetical protein PVI50_03535 [Gammaproteobacteria bacterium]|jgi:hypothetical protein
MKQPIITVEYSARAGGTDYREESVPIHNHEELFAFIAPGGGCDCIPDEVNEIQMVFLQPEHANAANPASDVHATLQIGMVYFSGPLAEITRAAEELLDRYGRGELAPSFLRVAGLERAT